MMIVIKEKAEERFLARLYGLKDSAENTRVAHYKLSIHGENNVSTTKITEAIQEHFEDAYVYIFDDGDIIIISNLITVKMFESTNHKLTKIFDIKEPNFSSIYEVEKSFSILSSIGKRKLEIKNESAALAKKSEEKVQGTVKVQFTPKPDTELLKRIVEKKAARTAPEVLVIEDDDFSRKLVCNSLKKDFKINQAANGSEGLNFYLTYAPNIVFLDIDMPGLNGHEVLKKIMEFDPDSFVVMLSGNGDKENVLGAVNAGAKGFVAKPFTKDKLHEYINKYKLTRRQ